MIGSFLPQICALFFIVLIIIVYFSKQRLQTLENKVYIMIILIIFATLVVDIISVWFIYNMDSYPRLNTFFGKLYLIFLLGWVTTFTVYTFLISLKEITNKKEINRIFIIASICFLIGATLLIIFPIEFVSEYTYVYSFGPAAQAMYFMTGLAVVIWIIRILIRIKYVITRKCLPIVIFVFLAIIGTSIQYSRPELLIVSFFQAFVAFVMFFTIENPDMQLINELALAKEQADRANESKSEFLSSMSHEIRTPLNAIVGFSQSLNEKELDKEVKKDIKDIISASEVLIEIVNSILDISKIEANKLEIVNVEYDLKKVLDEVEALAKGRLAEKSLDFRVTFDSDIPPVLFGDYLRLKQIMINLLTNAIKYTKEGYVEFKVNSVVKGDFCRLIISVEDSGIGIKKEDVNKLFDKFSRVDLEENLTVEGTGLGLAITKKLVELMEGQIVVQSVYGKGSRFTVAITQRIVKGVTFVPEPELHKLENLDFTGKRILVIDDNRLNLKVASRLLKDYNVEIDECLSGFECIEKINSNEKYDLLLLDDMMPRMTGTETMQRLKGIEGFNTPVVVLTANAIVGMREKYLNAGFDDYLSKPIDRNELNRVINDFLSKK